MWSFVAQGDECSATEITAVWVGGGVQTRSTANYSITATQWCQTLWSQFLEGKCGEYIVANVGRNLVAWQSKGAQISDDKMRAMYFAECKNPLNGDP